MEVIREEGHHPDYDEVYGHQLSTESAFDDADGESFGVGRHPWDNLAENCLKPEVLDSDFEEHNSELSSELCLDDNHLNVETSIATEETVLKAGIKDSDHPTGEDSVGILIPFHGNNLDGQGDGIVIKNGALSSANSVDTLKVGTIAGQQNLVYQIPLSSIAGAGGLLSGQTIVVPTATNNQMTSVYRIGDHIVIPQHLLATPVGNLVVKSPEGSADGEVVAPATIVQEATNSVAISTDQDEIESEQETDIKSAASACSLPSTKAAKPSSPGVSAPLNSDGANRKNSGSVSSEPARKRRRLDPGREESTLAQLLTNGEHTSTTSQELSNNMNGEKLKETKLVIKLVKVEQDGVQEEELAQTEPNSPETTASDIFDAEASEEGLIDGAATTDSAGLEGTLNDESDDQSTSNKNLQSPYITGWVQNLHNKQDRPEINSFVICSSETMECALCSFTTDKYNLFKSHIICSHPNWRLTKKLSKNRHLVEQTVRPNPSLENTQADSSSGQKVVTSEKSTKSSKVNSKKKVESTEARTVDKSKGDMRQRQLLERNQRLFKCKICYRLFVFEGSATNHVLEHHNRKKPYNHILVSTDHGKTFGPIYRCDTKNCYFTCGSEEELEDHSRSHLLSYFQCQLCGFTATDLNMIQLHVMEMHTEDVTTFDIQSDVEVDSSA